MQINVGGVYKSIGNDHYLYRVISAGKKQVKVVSLYMDGSPTGVLPRILRANQAKRLFTPAHFENPS